ncbi:MAG: DUF5685 family protein [Clostridia bacterium]|jgi:hypothetical protein
MIGYIKTFTPELKVKEYTRYNAYYCGICNSIKKRYGQIPRLLLNYDCIFITVLTDSILKMHLEYEDFRCIVHPIIKKKRVIASSSVDYAADMNIYLAYKKLEDDIADENNMLHSLSRSMIRKYADRIRTKYPQLTGIIDDNLYRLMQLEREKCENIDEIADCYANTVKEICIHMLEGVDEVVKRNAGIIAYNIGKWVYVCDAYNDIEKDVEKDMYNPYISRFKDVFSKDIKKFKGDIKERTSFIIYAPMKTVTDLYEDAFEDMCDPIIKNIIYEGIYDKTEKILNGDK